MSQIQTIQGPYANKAKEFKILQAALDITNERQTNHQLRNKWFITGDNPLYQRQGDTPILTFTGYPLILNNLDDAIPELRNSHNYTPSQQELAKAREQSLVEIDLSQLRLEGSGEWGHVVINTLDYSRLNPEEMKLVSIPFGEEDQLEANMNMLKQAGIRNTRAYVLTPEYVLDSVEEGSGVARLGRLYGFGDGSIFDAGDWFIDDPDDWLRGVLNSAAGAQTSEGIKLPYGAQEFLDYAQSHPKEVANAMQQEDLAGLGNILTLYATREQ